MLHEPFRDVRKVWRIMKTVRSRSLPDKQHISRRVEKLPRRVYSWTSCRCVWKGRKLAEVPSLNGWIRRTLGLAAARPSHWFPGSRSLCSSSFSPYKLLSEFHGSLFFGGSQSHRKNWQLLALLKALEQSFPNISGQVAPNWGVKLGFHNIFDIKGAGPIQLLNLVTIGSNGHFWTQANRMCVMTSCHILINIHIPVIKIIMLRFYRSLL